ncbi:pyrroloquinoline quinone precursor peptide PqqA [Ideonella sp. 4Y16]|uniref:pyrroloquinoline quinone precursor peptide PqqA n=1 Tax=Ideonella alba TaxID=2824118 RepID=UPI001B395A7A|nr:pyrroloquinoline quinone precursor peptide PqqA [Ideonella alba]MBQ0945826.1 pyrroloquinoline quinone precursor peptide PqqA [Ideonella alba]
MGGPMTYGGLGTTLRHRCHPGTALTKETFMTWETPSACDFRFGFEITMYIAAR